MSENNRKQPIITKVTQMSDEIRLIKQNLQKINKDLKYNDGIKK